MRAGLFERGAPRPRWRGSVELVLLDRVRCLRCDSSNYHEVIVREGCLFRGWDMGADRRTTWRVCDVCGRAWVRDVTEVRPA